MKFSRDAAIPRIPAPHLLKQGQLQLAGASFRDESHLMLIVADSSLLSCCCDHQIRQLLHKAFAICPIKAECLHTITEIVGLADRTAANAPPQRQKAPQTGSTGFGTEFLLAGLLAFLA